MRSARVLGEQRFPMTEEDRQFNPLPLSGLGALQPFNGCLAVGAAFVGMEHFNAQDALMLLQDERCTVAFPAVDRLWAAVLDQPDLEEVDLSKLWLVAVDGDAGAAGGDRRGHARRHAGLGLRLHGGGGPDRVEPPRRPARAAHRVRRAPLRTASS